MCWEYEDLYGVCLDHMWEELGFDEINFKQLLLTFNIRFKVGKEGNARKELYSLMSKWHEEGRLEKIK